MYKRYPHVGVGLEAEGEDGGADEEHGDDAHTLQHTHISYYFFVLTSFETTIIIYMPGPEKSCMMRKFLLAG